MTKFDHVNVGGLVLCKKLLADKSYVFQWRREDIVYRSDRMFKVLRWVKEKIFFIQQWNAVDSDEWKMITGEEPPKVKR
jgi:hypothetical protein